MRSVIVCLTRKQCERKLIRSLNLLTHNFLQQFPCDVILFHEGDFDKTDIQRLRGYCPRLRGQQIDLTPPHWIDTSRCEKWAMYPKFRVGYRSMCRFFSMGVYPYLCDLGYDYYMRLDDDSYIQSPITQNLFQQMEDNGWRYGWRATRPESNAAIVGLKQCLAEHDPRFHTLAWRGKLKIYYNNFHIAHCKLWTEEPFKSALEHIDQHGGIYTRRWGDAPIQTLLVKQYLPASERHQFTSFGYTHGRHSWAAKK
jgi:alpha 1,2-mannosyltransferase